MAPKLYGILPSPPVRSVLICAKELGIELEFVIVNLLEREHLESDFLKKNPQHTVPVLEDDDGFIVSDSHAIMAYLVAKYGQNDLLYPKDDYKQRATIDHILHFDSSILFNRGLDVSKSLVFHGIQPTQKGLEAVKEALEFLEQILENNKMNYVAGNNLTIADFSIITSVTSWDVFMPYTEFPNITAYVERIKNLPCYDANKKGLEMYKALIGSKLLK